MSHSHPYKMFLMKEIFPQNMEGLSVLDCGCGRGDLGFFIRMEREGSPLIEGFDIWEPYIKALERLNIYDRVYCMDIREVGKIERKYDVIICTDVLEHLNKIEALLALIEMERICKGIMLISLPIGFQSRGVLYDGNKYQRHLSGFSPDEMIKRGYQVKRFYRYPRTLRFLNRVRCLLLGLKFEKGRFIAWKYFVREKNSF